jgi:hypothetical protein
MSGGSKRAKESIKVIAIRAVKPGTTPNTKPIIQPKAIPKKVFGEANDVST